MFKRGDIVKISDYESPYNNLTGQIYLLNGECENVRIHNNPYLPSGYYESMLYKCFKLYHLQKIIKESNG